MDISATKLINGAWQFSTIAGGRLITRTYYGYTKRDALAEFKAELESL